MDPTERTRQIADEALSRLSLELESGKSETLRNYLAAMGRFRRYSWGNVLLIHSQRPDATRVAGFHAWRQLDRTVRKGEKGIVILAPVVTKQKTPESEQDPVFQLTGFRTAYVFDISQTEGKPLPQFGPPPGSRRKLLKT
jgi:antirestriction protein ArdC